MSDTKAYLGIVVGTVYVVGFLAVQVHLLRFGILEISPLQAYYLIVGLWFLLCIAPGLAAILAAEYLLATSDSTVTRLIFLCIGVTVLLGAIARIVQLSVFRMVFNFNTYPYPSWYAYWNIASINIAIVIIWIICFIYSRLRIFRIASRKIAGLAGTIFLANSVIFFGRTIYPALDHGVGGGAPQFAMVTDRMGKKIIVLQVYASEKFLYLLELGALPVRFTERSAITQFVTDSSGPVYRALSENQVLKIGNDQVVSVKILGLNQKAFIDSNLKK